MIAYKVFRRKVKSLRSWNLYLPSKFSQCYVPGKVNHAKVGGFFVFKEKYWAEEFFNAVKGASCGPIELWQVEVDSLTNPPESIPNYMYGMSVKNIQQFWEGVTSLGTTCVPKGSKLANTLKLLKKIA